MKPAAILSVLRDRGPSFLCGAGADLLITRLLLSSGSQFMK